MYKFSLALIVYSLQMFCLSSNINAKQPNLLDHKISILNMKNHSIKHGDVFEYQPSIKGDINICRKDFGHDDVQVHPQTGKISWDTSNLAFGRGFYIRIKCSNYYSFDYGSMIVHVDKSGMSKIIIAGENGISPYMGVAGQAMKSGDTLIMPDGIYPVSVSRDKGYENAFKMSAPTNGTSSQFTTVIAQTPGGVTISGTANIDIGKQKNAFQLSESNNVAIVGFVVKDVQRESFTTSGPGNHLLIEFVGGAGAGTWELPCSDFKEARNGRCSNAGMRVNGGTPLFQSSYDWGHNRYGIMTRSSDGSLTRRSIVRLDEHRGDQPYGGFSNYCDKAHLSQDNIVFDSLAIAAPHYKNYAGLETYPATGCYHMPSELKTSGLLAVNNKLSLSLSDSKAGKPNIWEYIVSYDSEGTCTPQKNRCGAWLLQSKKKLIVENSFFGKTRGFLGNNSIRRAFGRNIEFSKNVVMNDIFGISDKGIKPEYLPVSLLYFRGRADTFYGDEYADKLTKVRRWPIAGEDIIAKNMRSYVNPKAFKVGGGETVIDGNRGGVKKGQNLSEYFWKYIKKEIPPLVVRVNKDINGTANSYRIAWENFSGSTRDKVQGWQVNCVRENPFKLELIKKLSESELNHLYTGECEKFAVQAIYSTGISGIAYIESSVD